MIDDDPSQRSLDEGRVTLESIASGGHAIVNGPRGPQVIHPEGADQPFRALVERVREGLLTLSTDGTIVYANTHFAQLLGIDVTDAIGAPFSRFVAPGNDAAIVGRIAEATSAVVEGGCRLATRQGPLAVALTLGPFHGGLQPLCCVVVSRDRERGEEARTIDVTSGVSGEASTIEDQFLALLNQELKTPLNTILGWTQILLADKSLSDVSRRAAETIERSVRVQVGLVGDLLDVTRLVAGRTDLETSSLDLAALAEVSLAAMRPVAEAKSIVLRQQVSGDPEVHGDPGRLRQILDALLSNALKFTGHGGTVDVTVDGGAGSVVLRVADTGAGMSSELTERLFQAFSQGDARPRQKGGLGLGLVIARRLAEAHGGTLVAASAGEGKGSVFTLSLPRPIRTVPPPPRARFQPRGELKGVVALLVDDDKDNLELTAYLLESAGCQVSTASSAAGALAILEPGKFHLLVSDIGLPDKDGLELIREIRARGYDADELPAIALTGYAGLHDARLVTAAGYQKHLTKPLDAPTLLTSATALARRRVP
jgi:PAS domain S-box-containing protein